MRDSKKNIPLEKLIERLQKKESKLKKIENDISYYRLILFILGIGLTFVSFFLIDEIVATIVLGISLITFIILILIHNKLTRGIKKIEKWIYLKNLMLTKKNVDWKNIPAFELGKDFVLTDIEIDLNIAGPKSLLQLINFASTSNGKSKLRDLFINQKLDVDLILKKQSIVKELIPLKKFRERFLLTMLMSPGIEQIDFSFYEFLKNSKSNKFLLPFFILLLGISITNLTLLTLGLLEIIGSYWAYTFILYIALYNIGWKIIRYQQGKAEILLKNLNKFGQVFGFINRFDFKSSPHLSEMLNPLINKTSSPVQYLNKIRFAAELLELRKNPVVWFFITFLFPADYFIALELEKFEAAIKKYLPKWMDSLNNLEAFTSLANFAVLNEGYTFAIIAKENIEDSLYKAEKIGHPLIPHKERVKNSFTIDKIGEINIITGSNMSGKSTFLRTIGLNRVMAFAGCVTDAEYLSLSLTELFTCIKVSDSVTDGISYFYAEVKRLKLLVNKLNENDQISLYLVDEIYKGTNNIERLRGSEALLKFLSTKNGAGLISTHDIELVNIDKIISGVKNYHFKEKIIDSKMNFDYLLRSGPCPTTNALRIMNIEGLPT